MKKNNRRQFIRSGGLLVAGGAAVLSNKLFAGIPTMQEDQYQQKEAVSAVEDLMREHGVLKRVLLIYQEIMGRIRTSSDFPPETVNDAANMIRNFIENYHEKLEDKYLFPRFRKANTLVDLVNVLSIQHQQGRIVTDKILDVLKTDLKNEDNSKQLYNYLHSFVTMYGPHEAREDTVLFPAFKKIISQNEYDSLGENFETTEHQLFGKDGFEIMVNKVEGIEKKLEIYNLSQFTPEI